MLRPRRLLIIVAVLGIVYVIWRQRRAQAPEMLGFTSPATPPPAVRPPVMSSSVAHAPPPAASAAGKTTPRRIVTRVHRGAPPSGTPATTDDSAAKEPAEVDMAGSSVTLGAAAEPPTPAQSVVAAEPVAEPAPPAAPVEPAAPESPEVIAIVGSDTIPESMAESAAISPADLTPEADNAEPPAVFASSDADSVPESGAAALPPSGGLVNLNTADLDTLIALPGIGPSLARRIVAYRQANGSFSAIEDLIAVQGIGPRNIREFRHLVMV